MIEASISEINVDELMEMIQAEVRQRKQKVKIPFKSEPSSRVTRVPDLNIGIDLPELLCSPGAEDFEIKVQYVTEDFLKYRDRNFVLVAYRAVLRRRPDLGGMDYFLENLRSGKMTKAEILGRLRYSPEGRKKRTKIKGLFWNFAIQSSFGIPILGYFSRFIFGVGNFPLIIHNFRVLEERAATRLDRHAESIQILSSKMEETAGVIGNLKQYLNEKVSQESLSVMRDEINVLLEEKVSQESFSVMRDEINVLLEEKVSQESLSVMGDEINVLLEEKVSQEAFKNVDSQLGEIFRQINDHKRNILDQQRRLALLLEEARKRLPEPISTEQIERMVGEEDQLLNAMYVSFEDQVRGTREDIKERQRAYLHYLEAVGAGSKAQPVLDVGCGRGEWLELLKEARLSARGVDINSLMLDECRKRGLDVVQGDALTYLRDLENNSLGALTAFQVVEHFSVKKLICLIDETFRVTMPGGIAILETPNPENVLVGSCTFYTDPSHKSPIPPDTLKFLLEYRGFVAIEVLRMNPLNFVPCDREDPLKDLIFRFNIGQDYAVIARKP
jgi:SAM-dependent methyltransferase